MKTIGQGLLMAELDGQSVSDRAHYAFICPVCRTVQSMALLRREGVPEDQVETQIAFSCVGRWNGAGPARALSPAPGKIGCDWTLGGLFKLHVLEVVDEAGKVHPMFDIASPEEAQALEREISQ